MTRDELLKAAMLYKQNAEVFLESTDDAVGMTRAQANATLAIACIQLAEAQKSNSCSLTVEDVKKAMDEAQEGMVVVVQALSEADEFKRAFTLWKKRTLARLRGGGSHDKG